MNLQHLKYIVEIAECRSITQASRRLFVSQPYLSRIVAETESRFKKKLFVRHSQGLELTDYGQKVCILARSVLHQVGLLERMESEDTVPDKTVKLTFSAANIFLKGSLLRNYLTVSNVHGYEVEFHETTIRECIADVVSGRSDFAVIVHDDYQKNLLESIVQGNELEYKELDQGDIYYHLYKDHPLASRETIPEISLENYPFVQLKPDDFMLHSREKFREEHPGIRAERYIVVSHYPSCLNLVKECGAVMAGNKWQISELERLGIKSIRFADFRNKLHFGILKKKKHVLYEESALFIRLLKESYGLNTP